VGADQYANRGAAAAVDADAALGLYFLHLFGRLSAGATSHKAEFAQSQNWLNQQVHNGVRQSKGANLSTDRQLEMSRINVPLIPAAHGVSLLRTQYGDSLKILMVFCCAGIADCVCQLGQLSAFACSYASTRNSDAPGAGVEPHAHRAAGTDCLDCRQLALSCFKNRGALSIRH
jgi:hypothetical protein